MFPDHRNPTFTTAIAGTSQLLSVNPGVDTSVLLSPTRPAQLPEVGGETRLGSEIPEVGVMAAAAVAQQ